MNNKYYFKDCNKFVVVDKLYINEKSNFLHIGNCSTSLHECKCITWEDANNLNKLINIHYCSKCIFQDIINKIKLSNS